MQRAYVLLLWAVLFGAACRVWEDRPEPIIQREASAIALVHSPFSDLQIPQSSWKEGALIPEQIRLGPWKEISGDKGKRKFQAPLPIRPRVFFFSKPTPGMKIVDNDGRIVGHKRAAKQANRFWTWDATHITLTLADQLPAPTSTAYSLTFDQAIERERRLNFLPSGITSSEDFVRARLQWGPTNYSGLLLPAPAVASFDVEIPNAAELSLDAGISLAELPTQQVSDGARLKVTIHTGDEIHTLYDKALFIGQLEALRFNLSPWEGQRVTLRFETQPGSSKEADYCFLANPIIASRQANPKRVVMIFVDTLRPDHMGIYGYDRDTTPLIDRWAKTGTTFTQARSIAPWTLPSYRTMVTGQYPNRWEQATTLQQTLATSGYATAMFAGNVYLSSNFDVHRGWNTHYAKLDDNATDQVNRALDWLKRNDGKSSLLMLHLMDPHLPYDEPTAYRRLFAGDAPKGLRKRFSRRDVLQATQLGESGRNYIRDRYDNNIKYVDDELGRFLSQLEDNDLVLLFSDHGEEFWEHGGFEHGHQFWDEIVRVPFIVRGPDVGIQRREEKVTLLNLTPTILEYAGVNDADLLQGQSLWPLLRNQEGWTHKDSGLGHPLYGGERWGSVTETHKYVHHNGRDSLYDLVKDPAEKQNQLKEFTLEDTPWHQATARAFDQDFPLAIRFKNRGSLKHPDTNLEIALQVPGGIRAIWVGEDPLMSSHADIKGSEETPILSWPGGYRGSRDVYVVPNRPIQEVLPDIILNGRVGTGQWEAISLDQAKLETTPNLAKHRFRQGAEIRMSVGRSPVPNQNTRNIVGHDDEMQEMLKALGYVTGNESP